MCIFLPHILSFVILFCLFVSFFAHFSFTMFAFCVKFCAIFSHFFAFFANSLHVCIFFCPLLSIFGFFSNFGPFSVLFFIIVFQCQQHLFFKSKISNQSFFMNAVNSKPSNSFDYLFPYNICSISLLPVNVRKKCSAFLPIFCQIFLILNLFACFAICCQFYAFFGPYFVFLAILFCLFFAFFACFSFCMFVCIFCQLLAKKFRQFFACLRFLSIFSILSNFVSLFGMFAFLSIIFVNFCQFWGLFYNFCPFFIISFSFLANISNVCIFPIVCPLFYSISYFFFQYFECVLFFNF